MLSAASALQGQGGAVVLVLVLVMVMVMVMVMVLWLNSERTMPQRWCLILDGVLWRSGMVGETKLQVE